MRGEMSMDDVRTAFFEYFDETATRVKDAQTKKLRERLEQCGFNTL